MRGLDRWALAAAALGLLLALPVLTYPLGRDQGMYANIAQAIRAGGLPFIDMWDIKPPAIYYIYAAGISLFGATPMGLRAIDLAATPFTLFALYHLTTAFAGQRAWRWAMLLFPVFYFTETFASLTQSDSLVTLPMTWAALCALRAVQSQPGARRALLWTFLCGVLCALVMWFKHYYAIFAAALALAHLWSRLRDKEVSAEHTATRTEKIASSLLKEVAAFAAGGLLIGVPSLVFFSSSGVLGEMLTIAQGTAEYNAQAFASLDAFWGQMRNYVEFRWWHWGPLLILAVSYWLVAGGFRRPAASSQQFSDNRQLAAQSNLHFPTILLWLWLIAGIVFVVIQAKGFDTHWIPLLPPLVMLASAALDGWLVWLSRIDRRLMVAGGAAAVILFTGILAKDTWLRAWPYLTGQQTQRAYWRGFQAGDLNAADSLRMARWLEERTQRGDSVYIWGFRPEIAFMAGLRPATRFQAQFALVGDRYPQAWKQENVDTLWAVLPEYVVIVRADNMPWVTGTDRDSNTILAQDYKALEDWLIFNYDRGEEIGNFLTWKRKERA
jgi:4-amino-4-deoxy-L-arabinose transferase-like glycosyltransferase